MFTEDNSLFTLPGMGSLMDGPDIQPSYFDTTDILGNTPASIWNAATYQIKAQPLEAAVQQGYVGSTGIMDWLQNHKTFVYVGIGTLILLSVINKR